MKTSVFDLFKVGIGPSSSHTVGPMRAARAFAMSLGEDVRSIRAELYGSLALTGKGHATDRAILLGLAGETPAGVDPDQIEAKLAAFAQSGIPVEIVFHMDMVLPGHSNAMRFTAYDAAGGVIRSEVAYSIGGGFLASDAAQGKALVPYPFSSGAELLARGKSPAREYFLNRLHADPERYFEEYLRRFGNVLNADNAATLFEEYNAAPMKYREAVHAAAVEIRDGLFQRKLASDSAAGKDFVVFTAGGNAAGKSTVVRFSGSSESAHVVFDSTFSDVDHARRLVGQALASGKPVLVQHVERPLDQCLRGMVARSRVEGRVVTIRQMINSQRGAANTVWELQREFAGDPRVVVQFFDNNGGSPRRIWNAPHVKSYAESRDQLDDILDSEYRQGRITEAAWHKIRESGYDRSDAQVHGGMRSEGGGGVEQAPSRDLSGVIPGRDRAEEVVISTPFWRIMLENEKAWCPEAEIREYLAHVWHVMEQCVERGLRTEGILPGGLNVRRRAPRLHRRLLERGSSDPLAVMDWVNVFAMAVNEENAAGGRVVTAPTNGAAGIIPAVGHYYMRWCNGASAEGIFRYLLTAGVIGVLYKENASISGAEVGCQGEVGVACSMAAAGLVAALEGSNEQIEHAAEIGMEHNLGMTCDPIGGLVQIPCIERNAIGAVKAINACRMSMQETGGHKVQLDQVIKTMYQTGLDMQSRYKETSLAGLAVNAVEC